MISIRTTMAILFLMFIALISGPAYAQELRFTEQDDQLMQACMADAINSEARRACVKTAAAACFEEPDGYTTYGTTNCYLREETWWDDQLNKSYGDLRKRLSPELFEALKQAQIAWLPYRDAKCDFAYKIYEGGPIRHILFSNCKLHTTASRANDLLDILLDIMG